MPLTQWITTNKNLKHKSENKIVLAFYFVYICLAKQTYIRPIIKLQASTIRTNEIGYVDA